MDIRHQDSDRQSMLLTQAAVKALAETPQLRAEVLATLDRWDSVAPSASKALRDEWRDIVSHGDWQRALDPGDRGQQLRQASPLGKALQPGVRLAIIRQCKGRSSNT